VVGVTLALGIGLSTAIFSVVYGVVLKPLPYFEPSRVMAIWNTPAGSRSQRINVNGLGWRIWRERAKSFEDIALARLVANFNLTGDSKPERLQGARTSSNLSRVLGVEPLMGRFFTEPEQLGDAKVAVLSYWLWKRRFGGSTGILGRQIQLNGDGYEVIGVMPARFQYPSAQFELWTPLYMTREDLSAGLNYNFAAVGRLKPGVSVEQAESEMSSINRQISAEYRVPYRTAWGSAEAIVEPLLASNTSGMRSAMWLLLAAVGCLLLTGCFNLAILLIARSGSRAKELAVRAAFVASGGRLRRQVLAEVIPLSLAGAAGGVLLAWLLLRSSLSLLPAQLPRIEAVGLNGLVLAFAITVSFFGSGVRGDTTRGSSGANAACGCHAAPQPRDSWRRQKFPRDSASGDHDSVAVRRNSAGAKSRRGASGGPRIYDPERAHHASRSDPGQTSPRLANRGILRPHPGSS
jgi:predicted permease